MEQQTALNRLLEKHGLPQLGFPAPPPVRHPNLSVPRFRKWIVPVLAGVCVLTASGLFYRSLRAVKESARKTSSNNPPPSQTQASAALHAVAAVPTPGQTPTPPAILALENRIQAACEASEGDEARIALRALALRDPRRAKVFEEPVRMAEWLQTGHEIRIALDEAEACMQKGDLGRGLSVVRAVQKETPWWAVSDARICRLWVLSGTLKPVDTMFGMARPDAQVELAFLGHRIARTEIRKDTCSPFWLSAFLIQLHPKHPTSIQVKHHRWLRPDLTLLQREFRAGVPYGIHTIPDSTSPSVTLVLLPMEFPLENTPPSNWRRKRLFASGRARERVG